MKPQCMKFFTLVAMMVAFSTAQATILTFDQTRNASGAVIATVAGFAAQQDYGDHVAAAVMNVSGGQFTYGNSGEGFTPNISVEYFTTANSPGVSLWEDSYGDLDNVLFPNQNSESLNIRFSGDAGFSVRLYGFDLAGWRNTDYTINAIRIFDSTAALFSANDVLVQGDFAGARHTSFEFATPLSGSELLVQIDYSNLAGGQHDNIGIDNIRFGQEGSGNDGSGTLPEPATAWLLGLSAAGLTLARRSRKARTIAH